MARPNESDMLPKCNTKVRFGIYHNKISTKKSGDILGTPAPLSFSLNVSALVCEHCAIRERMET